MHELMFHSGNLPFFVGNFKSKILLKGNLQSFGEFQEQKFSHLEIAGILKLLQRKRPKIVTLGLTEGI